MKVRQPGYIIARTAAQGGVHFLWRGTKPYDDAELIVREHVIEFDVPADYDYKQELVKMLCIERAEIERQSTKEIEAINKRIDAAMGVVQESEL